MNSNSSLKRLYRFFEEVERRYILPSRLSPAYYKLYLMEIKQRRRLYHDPHKYTSTKQFLTMLGLFGAWIYFNSLLEIGKAGRSITGEITDVFKGKDDPKVNTDEKKVTFDDIQVN